MEPAVSSFHIEVNAGASHQEELKETLSRCLSSVSSALRDSGCPLIGHIKLLWSGGGSDYLMVDITSFDESPQVKGELRGEAGKGCLTVHAVAYGIQNRALEKVLKDSLQDHLPPYSRPS